MMNAESLLGWLNFIVLSLTLVCVAFYLYETYKLRKAAQEQVKASFAQAKASHEQLEAQIRPSIVFRKPDLTTEKNVMQIHNVGSGPAIRLIFAVLGHNQQVDWDRIESEFPSPWSREFVSPGVADGPFFILPSNVFGNWLAVRYESLSGKSYASVVFIDGAGDSVRTEFLARPASPSAK